MIKAVAAGVLWETVDCYVLDGEVRVISQRGAVKALTGGTERADLGRYLERLPVKFKPLSVVPVIEFIMPQGGIGHGIKAETFVDILNAYVDAGTDKDRELHASQMPLVKNAVAILRSLQKTGLAALIDEATGWQYRRKPNALSALFEKIFGQERATWDRMFQPSLVRELSKLDGVVYDGGRQPYSLQSTNRKIYAMVFNTEIGKELKRRNPVPSLGHNHHQELSPEARTYFRGELRIVEAIAVQSNTKEEFWVRMERQYPVDTGQIELRIVAPVKK